MGCLTYFWPMFPFYTPENNRNQRISGVFRGYKMGTKRFLVFSGGIKWEHWPEMG